MDKKYITFYKKFILQTKTLNDCRVVSKCDLELNRRCYGNTWIYIWNYGYVFGNDGIYIWNYVFKKNRKTYKTTERKGNPRTGLQRRLIHTSRQLRHGRVEQNR